MLVFDVRFGREDDDGFPVAENQHVNGILDISIAPAAADDALQQLAIESAVKLSHALNYVGVMAVEFFISAEGELLVNEMAPRPHNSGHYSIDACDSSQFEQQARVLAGWPLGSVEQNASSVMINLLGDLWFTQSETSIEPDWNKVLSHPRAKLHLYGKREARKGRKMGHVTVLADDVGSARTLADAIDSALHQTR